MSQSRVQVRRASGLQRFLQAWVDTLARWYAALRQAGWTGTEPALFPPSVPVMRMVRRGAPAPLFRKPGLAGNVVDLADFQEGPVLLLFWSPGCPHCEGLLPYVLAFERLTDRLRIIVISRGSILVNRELGFVSPVVLDNDHAIGQAFGVVGTPAAITIAAQGMVATGVARGAAAVRAHVDRCRTSFTTLT